MTKVPKTSDAYPIGVNFLPPEAIEVSGKIGMTFAPGKKGPGRDGNWDRHLDQDLKRLKEGYGASLLVCLLEPQELTLLHIEDLFDRAREHEISTVRLPMPDGGVPADPRALEGVVQRIVSTAKEARNVIVHCRGGLGRTGLVVACCLVSAGRDAKTATELVRAARPGAIENGTQERWIRQFARGR